MSEQPTGSKEPEIRYYLSRLDDTADLLQDRLETLSQRLRPILSLGKPISTEIEKSLKVEPVTPLANELQNVVFKIDKQTILIDELIERLEI